MIELRWRSAGVVWLAGNQGAGDAGCLAGTRKGVLAGVLALRAAVDSGLLQILKPR